MTIRSNIFDSYVYKDDPLVIVGLHDGKLIEQNSIMLSERIINRLQFIGKAYELHLVPLIDSNDDVGFNSIQCENLIEELNFIISIVDDKLLKEFIEKIIVLADACIRKNNSKIKLFFSGN